MGRRQTHYIVDKILDKRTNALGFTEYLLKWEGYGDEENQWVRVEFLQCPGLLEEFEANFKSAGSNGSATTAPTEGDQAEEGNEVAESHDESNCNESHDSSKEQQPDNEENQSTDFGIEQSPIETSEATKADTVKHGSDLEFAVTSTKSRKTKYIVEKILDKRIRFGFTEYLLKWEGYGNEKNQWVQAAFLPGPELLEEYEASLKSTGSSKERETSEDTNKSQGIESLDTDSSKEQPPDDDNEDEYESNDDNEDEYESMDSEIEQISKADTAKCDANSDFNDQSEAVPVRNRIGFDRGLEVERIVGSMKSSCGRMLLIKWKGMDRCELVSAEEANLRCPKEVIKYYEENTKWGL